MHRSGPSALRHFEQQQAHRSRAVDEHRRTERGSQHVVTAQHARQRLDQRGALQIHLVGQHDATARVRTHVLSRAASRRHAERAEGEAQVLAAAATEPTSAARQRRVDRDSVTDAHIARVEPRPRRQCRSPRDRAPRGARHARPRGCAGRCRIGRPRRPRRSRRRTPASGSSIVVTSIAPGAVITTALTRPQSRSVTVPTEARPNERHPLSLSIEDLAGQYHQGWVDRDGQYSTWSHSSIRSVCFPTWSQASLRT